MCTVTWLAELDSYQVFFNRDEKRQRKPAQRPAIHDAHGVRLLYPVDGQAGGTWLGVNAYGLTLGVMNYYAAGNEAVTGRVSRGKLVQKLLELKSVAEVRKQMTQNSFIDYAPFVLIAIDDTTLLNAFTWDNHSVSGTTIKSPGFLTTSSYDPDQVAARRKEFFTEFSNKHAPLTAEKLIAFHSSQSPESGPNAICMEREDAQTLSFSHVLVTPALASFTYTNGPPCRNEPGEPVMIERR